MLLHITICYYLFYWFYVILFYCVLFCFVFRSQIIAIISWADCHDETGLLLHYADFAAHAVDVLCKLSDASFVEGQAKVLHFESFRSKLSQ